MYFSAAEWEWALARTRGTTWRGPFDVTLPGAVQNSGSGYSSTDQAALPRAQLAADPNRPGHIAIAYYGHSQRHPRPVNGYLTESFDARTARPTLYTSQLNRSSDPLYSPVESGSLPRNDYLGVTIAPDGTPWTALVQLTSRTPDRQGYVQSTGFAGRLVVRP